MRLILDIFAQTLQTLWAHKLRSFLTMFGIAWGVGSLLLLVGLGEGFRSGNRKQFNELGENVMFIWGGRAPVMNGSFTGLHYYYLTDQDYHDVATQCPDVEAVTPDIRRNDIRAVSDFYQSSGPIFGVLPDFAQIRSVSLASGRWLNQMDISQVRRVIVLGDEARRMLFPGRPFLGSTILLNGVRYQVIGSLERTGHGDNTNQNLSSYVPFTTMREDFPMLNAGEQRDTISLLNYRPRSRALHDAAKLEVHKIIARNHGGFDYSNPDAFDEWDTVLTSDSVGKIFDAMNVFLGSVGIVTLALGAIGVINIMLVAVADRTREIGLRKALGATNASIMFQFFIEGAFLTLLSGGLGMAGAAGLMGLLSLLPSPPGWDTPRLVPWTALTAVASLAFSGVVAGLYPARKAALLQPVEALRRE
ncbi:MAG TPA: ABC transporter permease [Terriglobales bacterium]|nr:ABC transporter permease [Terriglobales bacterium]